MAEASDRSNQGPARRDKERRNRRHAFLFLSVICKDMQASMVDLQLAQGSHGGLHGVGLTFVVP
jgi:hypothetical protein